MVVDVKKFIRESVVGLLVVAVPLFLAAGTLAWWAGWIFLALLFGCTGVYTAWMYVKRPELLAERMELSQPDQKAWDKVFLGITLLYAIAWLILMPLDAVRFHWSQMPIWLQGVGGVLFVSSFIMYFLTARENPYMAAVARVQKERGQMVISTGPYHYVRHPMYSGSLLLFLGIPLLLGSWYGVGLALGATLLLAWRAVMEERMLREELQGYESYMAQVKYRLIPYVW
jgi:protein-S-isoprenylcysteine O-methyltransferase Ste14